MLEAQQQLLHLARTKPTGQNPIDCMVLHEELQDAIFKHCGQKPPQLDRSIFGVSVFVGTSNEQVFYRATVELAPSYNRIAYSVKTEGEGGGWEIKIIDCKEIRSRYAIEGYSRPRPLFIAPLFWSHKNLKDFM